MLHYTDEETKAHLSEVSVLQRPFFALKIPVLETPILPSVYLATTSKQLVSIPECLVQGPLFFDLRHLARKSWMARWG